MAIVTLRAWLGPCHLTDIEGDDPEGIVAWVL